MVHAAAAYFGFTPEDDLFYNDYVEKAGKRSKNSGQIAKRVVGDFLAWIEKPLNEMKPIDAQAYCRYLDSRNLKCATKKNFLSIVSSFYDAYAKWDALTYGGAFKRNIFDAVRDFPFLADPEKNIAQIETEKKEAVLTVQKMKEMLAAEYTYSRAHPIKGSKGYFVMALIHTFCAPRISETASIKLENISTTKRYFMTGTENGARKTGKVFFAFPKTVAAIIAEYIAELKASGETTWLFPGRLQGHVHSNACVDHFGNRYGIRSHSYRKTMVSYLKRANVNVDDIEILTQHAPRGTVLRSYNQIPPEELVKMYDDRLPNEYKQLIEWLETL